MWALPLLLLVVFLTDAQAQFRICAFNLQSFNASKAADHRTMYTLTRVLSRYDLCLLQSVKDPGGSAVQSLLFALSWYDVDHTYLSITSKGLGPPGDLQQYVYLYRKETVKVLDSFQYEKGTFARKPFVIRVSSNATKLQDWALVPLHAAPQHAVQEIDQLYDIFQAVRTRWSTANVMFLGDFQAGCGHVTRADKKDIRLFTNTAFYWLIGDKEDTTIRDITDCPYDRIVIHGEAMRKNVVPRSAQAFNFASEFRMLPGELEKLGNRLPVEVELRSSRCSTATPLLFLIGLSVIVQLCLAAL